MKEISSEAQRTKIPSRYLLRYSNVEQRNLSRCEVQVLLCVEFVPTWYNVEECRTGYIRVADEGNGEGGFK